MKTLNFSNRSWHYRLAKFGNSHRDVTNICSYTKAVLTGLFLLTLLMLVILLSLFPVAYTLAWLAAMISTLSWIVPVDLALIVPLLILGLLVMYLLYCASNWWNERKQSDSFLSAARSSYFDKFCVPVKILDHKKTRTGE
jgi:hypothetical protein